MDQVSAVGQMLTLDRLEYDFFNRETIRVRRVQGAPYTDLRSLDRVRHEIDRQKRVKT